MFEVATNKTHRRAIQRAHEERAEVFAAIFDALAHPFRTIRWLGADPADKPVETIRDERHAPCI